VPRYRSWQEAAKDAVRDPVELCQLLDLPAGHAAAAARAARDFPLFVPRSYLARIERGNVRDPLLRQVLPLDEELVAREGFQIDPVGDRQAELSPGLLHKYHSRVLMVTTGACAVHCRYCFRRHFPYAEGPKSLAQWANGLAQIAADASLREVILSGGDPWMLADETLAELIERLAEIPHLRRLRVHTRLPLLIPQRVTERLVATLADSRLTPIVVIHANHARELQGEVVEALARLTRAGILLLNQSVLLAGVNGDADTLAELSERLVDLRVVPYYLHQLDRVAGAAHFEVSPARGRQLIAELRKRLSGYAVPRYVQETAGAMHKLVLA
jgi:EF-P beta-lysylation protein EpmB